MLPLLLTASQYGKKTGSDSSSELILWKVYPVGPLCKSGGVRELARVTSNSAKAFTGLAWVPAILPRYAYYPTVLFSDIFRLEVPDFIGF